VLRKIPRGDSLIFFEGREFSNPFLSHQKKCPLDSNWKTAKFATLVEPYLADAYMLARWLTRNTADADDVLQEACIRAYGAIEQQFGSNPRAWLLAIVRNTAYTWLKEKNRVSLVGLDELGEKDIVRVERGDEQGALPVDPETEMIIRADARQLEDLITGLPVEFREALVLRDIQGLGYHEIAEVTGVPIGTVMSRLSRARKRLIARLKETNA
jgi:RNA polymerase sigma-70 factor, ECF subfamily